MLVKNAVPKLLGVKRKLLEIFIHVVNMFAMGGVPLKYTGDKLDFSSLIVIVTIADR